MNGICLYPLPENSNPIGGGATANIAGVTYPTGTAAAGCALEEQAEREAEAEERRAEVETAEAGTVPVPVAAMMEGSAWRRSHSMVSPSDRWPSSRVSWKIRAAHSAGIRIRRPRPFTFVWRSLELPLFLARVAVAVAVWFFGDGSCKAKWWTISEPIERVERERD